MTEPVQMARSSNAPSPPGSRSEAFTQIVPANEVAGRGVTDCGIDLAVAWTAQGARRFQEEEVIEIAVINYPQSQIQ
jgi:hypothetical protein